MFSRTPIGNGNIAAFRIVGNVYFVGTFAASSHIIDTGDGLIFIDPGYINSLETVCTSVVQLGFAVSDIKYIINTHYHYDHVSATSELARMSGAKTLIGRDDAVPAEPYFKADILINDGDTLELGNTVVRFMETPGHTKGTVSFFFETVDSGVTYRVGMFGGAGANTLARGKFEYDGCREDYLRSLNRLREEPVDVFIGNHVWNNDTEIRGRILRDTGVNLFIDSKLWGHFLDYCEKRLDQLIASEAKES